MSTTPNLEQTGLRIPLRATVAVLLTAFITVLTWDVRRGDGLTALDPALSDRFLEYRTSALTAAARLVTVIGDTLTLTVLTVLVCAGSAWCGYRRDACLVAVTAMGAALLTFVGKRMVGRSRPPAVERLAFEPSLSYPSGHSLGSMAVIGIVTAVLVPRLRRFALRIVAVAAAVVSIGAVGFSRIYLGVHWPTDVLAGWSTGALWVIICRGAFATSSHRAYSRTTRFPILRPRRPAAGRTRPRPR